MKTLACGVYVNVWKFHQKEYLFPILFEGARIECIWARLNGYDPNLLRSGNCSKVTEKILSMMANDGRYTWIKGRVEGEYVYGVEEANGDYRYEICYDAGPGDLAVFEHLDIEYLRELLQNGTLKEREPDVWVLREMEGAQSRDIGEWWHEKLQLPNISEILERALCNYSPQLSERTDATTESSKKSCEKVIATQRNIHSGLQYQPVIGDGNCLYRAVAYYLGHGEDVSFLRNIVAANFEHNAAQYENFIPLRDGQSIQDYIAELRTTSVWAGDVEINILMKLLDRPIVIVGPDGIIRNKGSVSRYAEREPIFVSYNGGDEQGGSEPGHYDVLLLRDECSGRNILSEMLDPAYSPPVSQTFTPALNAAGISESFSVGIIGPWLTRAERVQSMFFSDPASTSEQRTELMQRVVNSLDEVASDARGKVEGKEIILVIGGAGAGKSTFINYLAGCTMRPVTGVGLEPCVEAENPISEIGHGHNSITKTPKVFTDEHGLTYCDCPGLFDTEGTEAEIRNIFSIKYIASFAASVKAVVLIFNYYSLLSERDKNIRETMDIVHNFFGKHTRNYLPSIHVIVGRVTDAAVMGMSVSVLTRHLRGSDDVLNSLIENGRVGFYDPLNRAPAGSGALTRDTLLQVFRSSTAITRFNEVIRVSLSSDSINALGGVIRFVKTTAIEDFERGDFDRVNSKIVSTERLRVLGVSVVSDVFGDMIGTLNEKIRRLDSLDTLQRIKEKITNPVLSETTNERMVEVREQIRQREEGIRRAEEEARRWAEEELQRERNKSAPPPTICQCQCQCHCGGDCPVM